MRRIDDRPSASFPYSERLLRYDLTNPTLATGMAHLGQPSSSRRLVHRQIFRVVTIQLAINSERSAYVASYSHRLRDRCTRRICTVNRLHNPIACAGRQCAYTQCLYCSIRCASLRPDGDPVLNVAETEEDNDRDGDGDEQGVCHILHREVRYHWNQAA